MRDKVNAHERADRVHALLHTMLLNLAQKMVAVPAYKL
jgi:hypothetical protein